MRTMRGKEDAKNCIQILKECNKEKTRFESYAFTISTFGLTIPNCAYIMSTPKGIKIGQTTKGVHERLFKIIDTKEGSAKKRQYGKARVSMVIACCDEEDSVAMESILRSAIIRLYPQCYEKNDWFNHIKADEEFYSNLLASEIFKYGMENIAAYSEPLFV